MLATFFIELAGAFWVLFRYKTDKAARLIVALLVFLGIFQLAEYMVCEGAWGISSLDWARIGYVSITLLPPLGLHLGLAIAQRSNRYLLWAAYGSAALFAFFFLFAGHGMQSHACLGNYVIFSIAPSAVAFYTLYYYGWLFVTVAILLHYRRHVEEKSRQQALAWLTAGYTVFIVPTILVAIVDPDTISGIPSIMCGFAVLLALILLFWVAPLVLEPRTRKPAPDKR